jgi:Protein of unknown function (DUF1499)
MNEQDIPTEVVDAPPPPPPPTATVLPVTPKLTGRDWQGLIVLIAGVGALLWGFLSALGVGWGFWEWSSGLKGVMWSFLLAIGAILFGLLFTWRAKKAAIVRPRFLRWIGMLAAIVYAGWIGTFVMAGLTVPGIHDISTDLADPPSFRALTLRADNWDAIPGEGEAEMKGMSPQQRWVVVHQKGYGDIRSVRINETVPTVIAKAERLAKTRGWEVVSALPEEGRLEATATSAFFRFKDDVVLRVKPTDTGEGSIVDMRSVSRVGQSDLGVNAKRVRSFLADLSGTVSTAQ